MDQPIAITIAVVTLIREGETSAIMNRTYTEEVRGITKIDWTPTHVVFTLSDATICAYKADRVHELATYKETE